MSISNLLVPNDLDLYCDALTADVLNIDTELVNTLEVSTIESNPPGGNLVIQGDTIDQTGRIIQPTTLDNRKIVMFPSVAGDSTNFFGFGVQSGVLRYEVNTTASNHIFYASTGLGTDIELLRVVGNGGGVIFPSVGAATAAQLNYYETISATYTFSGIWAASYTGTVSITRLGNQVTVNLQAVLLANATTASNISSSTFIPTRLCPAFAVWGMAFIQDNGTTAPGVVNIQTNGTILIYTSTGSFSGSATVGTSGTYGFSITYLVS